MYFTTYTQKNLGGYLIHHYNLFPSTYHEQALVCIEQNWLRCQRRNSRQNWDIHHVGVAENWKFSAHEDRMDSHSEKRRLPKALRFGINDSWSGLLHSQGWSLDWWLVQRKHNEVPSQAGKTFCSLCVYVHTVIILWIFHSY